MAASDVITADGIAEDGAVRDGIQKEFEDFGEYLPEFEDRFLSVCKSMAAGLNQTGIPTTLNQLTELEAKIKKVSEAELMAEKISQAKINTQIKENTLAKSTIDLQTKQVKVISDTEKAQAKATKEQVKANSAYEQAKIQLNQLAKQLKDLEVAGQGQAASTKVVRAKFEKLHTTVEKAEQSVG